MKKKNIYIIVTLLIIASLAAFGRIAGNHFINFDDPGYVTRNYNVQSGFNIKNIKWAFTAAVEGNWHPLTWLSHMLDWSLLGANAFGFFFNLLILKVYTCQEVKITIRNGVPPCLN